MNILYQVSQLNGRHTMPIKVNALKKEHAWALLIVKGPIVSYSC